MEGNKTVVSGKRATLSCWYKLPERVRQVLWRKTAEQGDTTTVASYAKQGQPIVEEPFKGRVSLSRSLGDTQLTIQQVRTEDEACYTCEFHTYPEGTRSATACLSVYGASAGVLMSCLFYCVYLSTTEIDNNENSLLAYLKKIIISTNTFLCYMSLPTLQMIYVGSFNFSFCV